VSYYLTSITVQDYVVEAHGPVIMLHARATLLCEFGRGPVCVRACVQGNFGALFSQAHHFSRPEEARAYDGHERRRAR
jgi:hypothetical protein